MHLTYIRRIALNTENHSNVCEENTVEYIYIQTDSTRTYFVSFSSTSLITNIWLSIQHPDDFTRHSQSVQQNVCFLIIRLLPSLELL